jgi:iron complex transport system ATP-binding protein
MNLIDVDNVSFSYGGEPILEHLSFSVCQKDFLAILGPNGSGKTTLINLLAGLSKPKTGHIRIRERSVSSYRRTELARVIAMVRQESATAFGFTVCETVMMARYLANGGKLFETRQDREIVDRSLEVTEIKRFADRPLNCLSGGERQRVFIARALAQQTPILLLDEPTSHLDLKYQLEIFELLRRLCQQEQKTIIVVSHDINLVQHYATAFLMLAAGGRMLYKRDAQGLDASTIESFFGVQGVEGDVAGRRVFIPIGQSKTDGS